MECWRIDPAFSTVAFVIPQMGPLSPKGRFLEWDGKFSTEEGSWLSAKVELGVAVASLSTGDAAADNEAVSARFLDADTYPEIRFTSREVESVEDAHVVILGDLTIRGVTRPQRVEVDFIGRARDLAGSDRMSWEIHAGISRTEFGLLWHPALEDVAGFMIGDTITITGELEFVRDL